MGFLGIGAMEALVILVIALIIFGPGRLPEMMGEAGRMVRDFRRATRELTGDFEESISEVRGTYRELEDEMRQTASDFRRDAQGMADDVNAAVTDITTLDDAKAPAKRRRTARPKLDQADADPIVDESVPATPSPAKSSGASSNRKREPAAVSKPSNGAVDHSDDLLAADEGDDLLAADDTP